MQSDTKFYFKSKEKEFKKSLAGQSLLTTLTLIAAGGVGVYLICLLINLLLVIILGNVGTPWWSNSL
jgi:hypothetical protein